MCPSKESLETVLGGAGDMAQWQSPSPQVPQGEDGAYQKSPSEGWGMDQAGGGAPGSEAQSVLW